MKKTLNEKKRVLAFNALKRLVAVFDSCNSAASAFNVATVSVYYACVGKSIICNGLYFRYIYEDKIELELLNDLGSLQLEAYDKMVGLERKYYATKKQAFAHSNKLNTTKNNTL